ncbi:MAG: hypothetical protein U9N73_08460 [Candidatus Auribacterota bacterium]|nr:hypothetical protein [Candidatus Auribacterota bacterium]
MKSDNQILSLPLRAVEEMEGARRATGISSTVAPFRQRSFAFGKGKYPGSTNMVTRKFRWLMLWFPIMILMAEMSKSAEVRNDNKYHETTISSVKQLNLIEDTIVQVEADAGQGFNFPYYLFIPNQIKRNEKMYILVEPNNSGNAVDNIEFHKQRARRLVGDSYANWIARRLGIPLLVPVFPRWRKNWQLYTHALDRDTLMVTTGRLQRIDLQLIAMIRNAQAVLRANGIKVQSRVFLHGFSASGHFVNRFAVLHPEIVKAVASGAVNGIPILPIEIWKGHKLPYPIGIADLGQISGAGFNSIGYHKVAQYIYMGHLDRNDTVPYRDAWSEEEADLIKKAIGARMMPDRWEVSQTIYRKQGIPAQCVTYNGVAHTIKSEMMDDIVEFFQVNSGEEFVKITPHSYPVVEHKEIRKAHPCSSPRGQTTASP